MEFIEQSGRIDSVIDSVVYGYRAGLYNACAPACRLRIRVQSSDWPKLRHQLDDHPGAA